MTEGDAFTVACGNPALQESCPQAKGPDFDFGSSPILVNLPNGRRALIAGQKSGLVHAVDPDQQGEVLWQTRLGHGSALGGIQWAERLMAPSCMRLYRTSAFARGRRDLPARVPACSETWHWIRDGAAGCSP